jgi:hypothetical protein
MLPGDGWSRPRRNGRSEPRSTNGENKRRRRMHPCFARQRIGQCRITGYRMSYFGGSSAGFKRINSTKHWPNSLE